VLVADRVDLSGRGRTFLHASLRRDRLRRARVVTVLSGLLVLALTAAGIAIVQLRTAQERQLVATARQLVAQADSARPNDPRAALLLGIAAQSIHPDASTQSTLVNALTATRYAGTLPGHTAAVGAVAFAAGGRLLATGGNDGSVLLWDLTEPAGPRRVGAPPTWRGKAVSGVAFSPDSRVAGVRARRAHLGQRRRRPGGAALGRRRSGPGAPDRPALDRPRRHGERRRLRRGRAHLASGGNDRTLRLWDVTDPGRAHGVGQPLTGHTLSVQSVAFGGRILAGGGEDKTVILWDIADPARPRRIGQPLTGPADSVAALAFSPDGHTLAADAADDAVILWDVTDLDNPRHLGQPLTGPVTGNYIAGSIAFAPQGRTLLAGALDDTVQWDLTALNELRAHTVHHACTITTRGLDRDEWSRYISGVAYRDTCPG
jgi:WD40 repeat protein